MTSRELSDSRNKPTLGKTYSNSSALLLLSSSTDQCSTVQHLTSKNSKQSVINLLSWTTSRVSSTAWNKALSSWKHRMKNGRRRLTNSCRWSTKFFHPARRSSGASLSTRTFPSSMHYASMMIWTQQQLWIRDWVVVTGFLLSAVRSLRNSTWKNFSWRSALSTSKSTTTS